MLWSEQAFVFRQTDRHQTGCNIPGPRRDGEEGDGVKLKRRPVSGVYISRSSEPY